MKSARPICSWQRARRAAFSVPCLITIAAIVASLFAVRGLAQEAPSRTVDADTTQFAIAPDNSIAFSIAKLKHFDKIVIERDELWVASSKGKFKQIIDPDKFMPVPPPTTYVIQSIAWSPDSQRLSLSMLSKTFPGRPK